MTNNQDISDVTFSRLPQRLFFLFSFLFFILFAGHIFYFQEKSSLFILSKDYFEGYLRKPGGLLEYLSVFLTSLYHFRIAGALIAALILFLILVLSSSIIRRISGKNGSTLPYLIVLVLFFLQLNYQYLLLNNLALMLQLLLLYGLIRKPESWFPVFLIPFWYYFTGGYALVFFIMYSLWQIAEHRPKFIARTSLFWLSGLMTFSLASEFFFYYSTGNLLTLPWSPEITGSQAGIYLIVASGICLLPALSEINIKNPVQGKITPKFYRISGALLLILIMTVIGVSKYDKKTLHYFRAEKLFIENRYEELISFNLKYPSNNTLIAFLNNIALCETGRLNDLLFHFPQSPGGSTLFLKWEIVNEILRKGGYFYYSTGMINEAHRWAFENMVMNGLTPEDLKMLIRTELINGNHKMASRYIYILGKTLFYRNEAREFEKLVFNDRAIDADPELGQKRRIRVRKDFFTITDDPFINIERVIATDSLNRRAFEYKMAWLLLSKDYKGIANEWINLERYNFETIPVHVEEAAVALINLYDLTLPSVQNLTISQGTEQKFSQFLQVFQAYGANLKMAEPELHKRFGDTFWYYVFYK